MNLLTKWAISSTVRLLTVRPIASVGFLTLFDRPKRKEELHPVFKLPQRLKGHSQVKNKTSGWKTRQKVRIMHPRLSTHKGLLKRIKIVGPRYARRFKFASAHKRHLLRNKSRANLMRKRKARYIVKADMERVKKMIPYYKRRNFKINH